MLAVIKALQHWWQYLIWTQEPFIIQTDHANLLYWKSPRKLNRRTAQWHTELQDYNFQIIHIPGKSHVLADMLSRPPGVDQGEEDNTNVTMIPESSFIRVFTEDDMHLEKQVERSQNKHAMILDNWSTTEELLKQTLDPWPGFIWRHPESFKLVIPPDKELRKQIMKEWHDNSVAGHLGQDETTWQILANYHWPNARPWIEQYIKGCATCQQIKNLTHKTKTPLYPISVPQSPRPFGQIAMDLITGLPISHGYDAIWYTAHWQGVQSMSTEEQRPGGYRSERYPLESD